MANQKISQMPAASTSSGGDLYPLVQSSANKAITFSNLQSAILAGVPPVSLASTAVGFGSVGNTLTGNSAKFSWDNIGFILNVSGMNVASVAPHQVAVSGVSGNFTGVSPGPNGNVLTSNGVDWVSQAPTGGTSGITTIALDPALNDSNIGELLMLQPSAGVSAQFDLTINNISNAAVTGSQASFTWTFSRNPLTSDSIVLQLLYDHSISGNPVQITGINIHLFGGSFGGAALIGGSLSSTLSNIAGYFNSGLVVPAPYPSNINTNADVLWTATTDGVSTLTVTLNPVGVLAGADGNATQALESDSSPGVITPNGTHNFTGGVDAEPATTFQIVESTVDSLNFSIVAGTDWTIAGDTITEASNIATALSGHMPTYTVTNNGTNVVSMTHNSSVPITDFVGTVTNGGTDAFSTVGTGASPGDSVEATLYQPNAATDGTMALTIAAPSVAATDSELVLTVNSPSHLDIPGTGAQATLTINAVSTTGFYLGAFDFTSMVGLTQFEVTNNQDYWAGLGVWSPDGVNFQLNPQFTNTVLAGGFDLSSGLVTVPATLDHGGVQQLIANVLGYAAAFAGANPTNYTLTDSGNLTIIITNNGASSPTSIQLRTWSFFGSSNTYAQGISITGTTAPNPTVNSNAFTSSGSPNFYTAPPGWSGNVINPGDPGTLLLGPPTSFDLSTSYDGDLGTITAGVNWTPGVDVNSDAAAIAAAAATAWGTNFTISYTGGTNVITLTRKAAGLIATQNGVLLTLYGNPSALDFEVYDSSLPGPQTLTFTSGIPGPNEVGYSIGGDTKTTLTNLIAAINGGSYQFTASFVSDNTMLVTPGSNSHDVFIQVITSTFTPAAVMIGYNPVSGHEFTYVNSGDTNVEVAFASIPALFNISIVSGGSDVFSVITMGTNDSPASTVRIQIADFSYDRTFIAGVDWTPGIDANSDAAALEAAFLADSTLFSDCNNISVLNNVITLDVFTGPPVSSPFLISVANYDATPATTDGAYGSSITIVDSGHSVNVTYYSGINWMPGGNAFEETTNLYNLLSNEYQAGPIYFNFNASQSGALVTLTSKVAGAPTGTYTMTVNDYSATPVVTNGLNQLATLNGIGALVSISPPVISDMDVQIFTVVGNGNINDEAYGWTNGQVTNQTTATSGSTQFGRFLTNYTNGQSVQIAVRTLAQQLN